MAIDAQSNQASTDRPEAFSAAVPVAASETGWAIAQTQESKPVASALAAATKSGSEECATEAEVQASAPANKQPAAGETGSKAAAIAAGFAVLVTASNAFIGYLGWSSAKDIREAAEQAKEKQNAINQVFEGSYFLYARAVEREVSNLVAELPGIELSGPRTQEIKDAIRKASDNLSALESTVKADARQPTKYLVDGFLAITTRNCTGAIDSLNKYTREVPVKYHLLGVAHAQCRNAQQADAAYQKVIEISPFQPSDRLKAKAISNIANNDVRRGQFEDAIRRYDQALKVDPSAYGIYYNKAAVLVQAGQYENALRALCEYSKRHDGSVTTEIDTDQDRHFDKLKLYLSKDGDWRKPFAARIGRCA